MPRLTGTDWLLSRYLAHVHVTYTATVPDVNGKNDSNHFIRKSVGKQAVMVMACGHALDSR